MRRKVWDFLREDWGIRRLVRYDMPMQGKDTKQ
jgi:hypothetical protein